MWTAGARLGEEPRPAPHVRNAPTEMTGYGLATREMAWAWYRHLTSPSPLWLATRIHRVEVRRRFMGAILLNVDGLPNDAIICVLRGSTRIKNCYDGTPPLRAWVRARSSARPVQSGVG